jgi:hypothetical protein
MGRSMRKGTSTPKCRDLLSFKYATFYATDAPQEPIGM